MSVMTDPENVFEQNYDETQNSIDAYSYSLASPLELFSPTDNPDAPPTKRKKLNHSRLKSD